MHWRWGSSEFPGSACDAANQTGRKKRRNMDGDHDERISRAISIASNTPVDYPGRPIGDGLIAQGPR